MMKALNLGTEGVQKAITEQGALNKRYADAIQQYNPSDPQRAQLVDRLVRGADRAANDHIDDLVKVVRERGDKMEQELVAQAAAERTAMLAWLITIAISAIVASVVIGVIVIRSIVNPLREATELAQRVAQGDLTVTVT